MLFRFRRDGKAVLIRLLKRQTCQHDGLFKRHVRNEERHEEQT